MHGKNDTKTTRIMKLFQEAIDHERSESEKDTNKPLDNGSGCDIHIYGGNNTIINGDNVTLKVKIVN